MSTIHIGLAQVVHELSPDHHVNRQSGSGYMTLGSVEMTVFHPEDAYRIAEAFTQMGRDMEEWRSQQPAPEGGQR